MAGYKYVSPSGEFLEGIPARDLSLTEFEVLTPQHQEAVRTSGIYVVEMAKTAVLPPASPAPPPPPPPPATEAKKE